MIKLNIMTKKYYLIPLAIMITLLLFTFFKKIPPTVGLESMGNTESGWLIFNSSENELGLDFTFKYPANWASYDIASNGKMSRVLFYTKEKGSDWYIKNNKDGTSLAGRISLPVARIVIYVDPINKVGHSRLTTAAKDNGFLLLVNSVSDRGFELYVNGTSTESRVIFNKIVSSLAWSTIQSR